MNEQKKTIRQEIKSAKLLLTPTKRTEAELKVLDALKNNTHVVHCRNIAIYHSLPDELPTGNIIEHLLQEGHNVFLPVINGENIVFRQYIDSQCLRKDGKFGIAEPQNSDLLPFNEPFVVITPGIAFTATGQRIGRGGGYYDRFFAQCKSKNASFYTIGIAYKCQQRQTLPVESFDVEMDCVYFG